jgi:hypothetical protein
MAYTEIKTINKKRYYYRVKSVRQNKKVLKERIYLGAELNKEQLKEKEGEADRKLTKKKAENHLNLIKPKILKIIQNKGIKKAGIFGSYARGEQNKESDIDILIEPTKDMSFFDIINLEEELKKSLKKKVDLLTYASIHNLLKERIKNEEVRII